MRAPATEVLNLSNPTLGHRCTQTPSPCRTCSPSCCTCEQAVDRPQDRVPPRIATRKLSLRATATAPLTEPAGLTRKLSASTNAFPRGNDLSVPPDGPSRHEGIPLSNPSTPRRPFSSALPNPAKAKENEDREVSANKNHESALRPSANHAVSGGGDSDKNEDAAHHPASSLPMEPSPEKEEGGTVGRFSEDQSGPSIGASTEGFRAQDGVTPTALAPNDGLRAKSAPRAGDGDSGDDRSQPLHEDPESSRRVSSAAVEIAAALAGTTSPSLGKDAPSSESTHEERRRSITLTNSRTDEGGQIAGVQPQAAPSFIRTDIFADSRAAPLLGGPDTTVGYDDEHSHEARGFRAGMTSATSGSGGCSDSDGGRRPGWRPSTSQSVPESCAGRDPPPKPSRSKAVSSTPPISNHHDVVARASEDIVAMDIETDQVAGTNLISRQQHMHQGEEGQDVQASQQRARSEEVEHGSAVDILSARADARVGCRRRSSGGVNDTDDAKSQARFSGLSERGKSRHPSVTAGENETVEGVRKTEPACASRNRELLQSPPMISRRNSSGRRLEPTFGAFKTVSHTDTSSWWHFNAGLSSP